MPGSESGFQLIGTGPEAYERYMVPIHCQTRANDLLNRLILQPREHVLDVACGTGIVSRHAAMRVGPLGRVTGVELNPEMLRIARDMAKYIEQIEFVEGNAIDLPVSDSQFDVVFCQAAIQFISEREKAVREMYRALKPGGRVGMNVFRTAEHNPAFHYLRFIREFREAYSCSPLIRERLGRRFRRAGVVGHEAGRLKVIRPGAAEGGPVSGRKLLCFKHLRSLRALDPRRRSRFLYPEIRG